MEGRKEEEDYESPRCSSTSKPEENVEKIR
jgi:hypothetical protein